MTRSFVLDFGRYGKIYSHKGVKLESREQAQAKAVKNEEPKTLPIPH
jgi:hypothetical protein